LPFRYVRRRRSSDLIARIALDDRDDKKDARLVRGETSSIPVVATVHRQPTCDARYELHGERVRQPVMFGAVATGRADAGVARAVTANVRGWYASVAPPGCALEKQDASSIASP